MAAPTIASARASSSAPVTVVGDRLIGFDRLYSPANATTEIDGFGAIPTDPDRSGHRRWEPLTF
ncbi:MAG: hypothetical protein WKF60_06895 [Ilumatobacter sp.]